jgi:hypothetical protein
MHFLSVYGVILMILQQWVLICNIKFVTKRKEYKEQWDIQNDICETDLLVCVSHWHSFDLRSFISLKCK